MMRKAEDSSTSRRPPASSPADALLTGPTATPKRKVKKPVVKVLKDEDEETAPPEKKKKSASASSSTKPEFQPEKAKDARPARKPGQPRQEDPGTSSEESGPSSATTTRSRRDQPEKSASQRITGSATPPRSDPLGQAMLAIERGNLAGFRQLVPKHVPVDSISSQGRSLLAIARFHKQQEIVGYISEQLMGRAIKAIETADVEALKKLVPAEVQPDAVSRNGRSLLRIARYQHQQLEAIIEYLESRTSGDDLPSSIPPADAPGATTDARGKKVRTIEFYDKHSAYYEFTNFYQGKPIKIDGVSWKTAEHYFQAQKFTGKSIDLQEVVRKKATAREAFEFAGAHKGDWRSGWKTARVGIMRTVLAAKFGQDDDLRRLLCATGGAQLVEASRKDGFWGYGADGNGENMLGRLLMELRAELLRDEM